MFTRTYEMSVDSPTATEWVWEKQNVSAFNELIISWDGLRPENGKWTFWVSLHQEDWSPWLRYAEWGLDFQKTFQSEPENSFASSYQDAVHPKEGFCDAFRVKIVPQQGSTLANLKSVFACASNLSSFQIKEPDALPPAMLMDVPLQSQMVLGHPRHKDLCSPTSTATALNYLLGEKAVDPALFAEKIYDNEWDIYGNWILNTAQAYSESGGSLSCHVARMNSFSDLHSHLLKGFPVVVSIRGPIPGSAQPYAKGHLICVIGFSPEDKQVYCIDPAFPTTEETLVAYPLNDFLIAWSRRQNIAYVFSKQVSTPSH